MKMFTKSSKFIRICMVALSIMLSSSLQCASTQNAQEQMSIFRTTIKQLQNKLSMYQRCIKKNCSDTEKEKIKKELKSIGKKATIAAIAVTIIVGGSFFLLHKPIKGDAAIATNILNKLQINEKITVDDRRTLNNIFEDKVIKPDDIIIGGNKAIVTAIKKMKPKVVNLLLKNNANPNQRTASGRHILYDALTVLHARHTDNQSGQQEAAKTVKLLIENGADVNQNAMEVPSGFEISIKESVQDLNLPYDIKTLL